MKKILLAALWLPLMALAQSYPSPTFNNVTVNGTLTGKVNSTGSTITNATITGGTISGLSSPLPVASGGTNSASASGAALDNITGFAGTGFMSRTGAGAYSFTASTGSGNVVQATSPTIASPTITGALTAPGLVTTADLATQAANTVLANATASSASPTAIAMPTCSTNSSIMQYTTNTGFNCLTTAWASPVAIGNTTANSGAFTTLSSSGGLTVSSGGASITGASSFATSVTAPTVSGGNNTNNVATTAFVANHDGCASILDYGGDPTGVSNNDTAFTLAIAGSTNQTNYRCVYFPPGLYNFSAQAGFTFSSSYQGVSILGAGAGVTTLSWANNGGLGFSFKDGTDHVHISGMTLTAGTTNSGAGIIFTHQFTSTSSAAMSTIDHIAIRSSNGYFGTGYFQYGIDIIGVSGVNIDFAQIIGPGTPAGTGIVVTTDNVSVVPIVYNLSNSSINQWNVGFQYGNEVQGVQMSNMNFTNNNTGVNVAAGLSGLDQLSIINSQFNSLLNGYNILVASAVPNLQISNNLFLINNNSSGINLQGASSTTTITGNSFEPNTGSPSSVFGIVINGWTNAGSIISGNSFFNLSTGIALQSASKNVNVQSNVYQANATNTSNTGTGNVIGGGSP